MNPTNTIFDAKRLIGRKYHDDVVQSDMKHWPFKVVNDASKPKLQVEYKGEVKTFTPEKEKLISPLPRGGRRISSSTFLSRRPFGYYLPIASYGTIFAAKWSSNGGLEAVVSE